MLHKNRTTIKELLKVSSAEKEVLVMGWVRTHRSGKKVHFVALNDGSTVNHLQIVVDASLFDKDTLNAISTGSCLSVRGRLRESPGTGQQIELHAGEITVFGTADTRTYPLQKKGHSLEFLREIAHLRPRTNTFGAVLRIRHELAWAVHRFFHDRDFVYLHTPIITASDCEGAGEMFRVTTLAPVDPPRTAGGQTDFARDFFGRETSLTVSGQLEAELGALALSNVYTFGPTFRAENSNTPRHLAEFWMIEPEMAFYDLEDTMDLAEEFLVFLIRHVLEHCADDLAFLKKMYDSGLTATLNTIAEQSFQRLSYTEAVSILSASGADFEFPVKWGCDLQAEHERYLVETHFNKPVFVTDFPKEIKAFYMKLNDDHATVRAMDVLFPRIGEIIGGSQREDSYTTLLARVGESGIQEQDLWWYLETRKFGSAPHSGFGLGFERLVQFATGMKNIRDVIPFPRTPGNAEF